MALKPRHKRRILWTFLIGLAFIGLMIVIVPPLITLNSFRPVVEKSVYEQTNVPVKLNGDIHFSLIGGTTIVAHDVTIPTAQIGSIMFSIPFTGFFDLQNAHLNGPVVIYDAKITIDKLSPANFNHNIKIYNSEITFKNRKFYIVRADFTDGEFHGTIRTHNHKYDVEFIGDTFHITNRNNDLDITGKFYSDGSISGHMTLQATNINEWLGFKTPKIKQNVNLSTDFEWDGNQTYTFRNLDSDIFSGNIKIMPNGHRTIQLVSNDTNLDMSFLLEPTPLLHNTKIDIDFYGDLKLGNRHFKHLHTVATGTSDTIEIQNITADDIIMRGGIINHDGGQNIVITMPYRGKPATCVFSGKPTNWGCSKFTWDGFTGHLSTDGTNFDLHVSSNSPMPPVDQIKKLIPKIGKYGTIHFKFSNIGGTYKITPDGTTVSYNFATNKTLKWLKVNIPFLPPEILNQPGDYIWHDNMLSFIPHNKQWELSTYDKYFTFSAKSYKTYIPNVDLRFLNDAPFKISGHYDSDKISGLTINIFNQEFSGSVSNKTITLHTEKLLLDAFINPSFIKNFAEQEFLTNSPIMTLFDIPVYISLSADALVYNGDEYKNFTYSSKQNSQTFSITDATRGNILATIDKNKSTYEIFAQFNRFVINGLLLSRTMPLNIRDTMITGEVALTTQGKIAHDIYYNMAGNIDLTFTDGFVIGLSFDEFYASADKITSFNAEHALSNALTGGETKLKQMRIIGDYSNGNFITTRPLEISMRHVDGIGGLAIQDGQITAEFDFTLRGTAPTPATVSLSILPNVARKFSLSEIMQNFDSGFMRAFIKNHNRF